MLRPALISFISLLATGLLLPMASMEGLEKALAKAAALRAKAFAGDLASLIIIHVYTHDRCMMDDLEPGPAEELNLKTRRILSQLKHAQQLHQLRPDLRL